MPDTKHIHVRHDADAGVWWAESDDLPGLLSESPTLDGLIDRVTEVASDLLRANGVLTGTVALEFIAAREVVMA